MEQSITPQHITVHIEQGGEPAGPCRTTRVSKPSDKAKRIAAREGITGEELDFVFHADYDDIINSAIQRLIPIQSHSRKCVPAPTGIAGRKQWNARLLLWRKPALGKQYRIRQERI